MAKMTKEQRNLLRIQLAQDFELVRRLNPGEMTEAGWATAWRSAFARLNSAAACYRAIANSYRNGPGRGARPVP